MLSLLKKVFVGSKLRRFILVIILSVVTGMLSYNFYQNKEFQNLRNKNEIVEDKLKDMVKEDKEYFDLRIKCLGIEDEAKREDSFFKTEDELYHKSGNKDYKMLFRFVTVNNESGEMFWEDWPYKGIFNKYEPKEVNINKSNVESYISKNSYTYIKYGQNYAKGYISILPKNPGEKKTDITNWTTYYWLDKRDYSSDDIIKSIDININNARKMAALICALGIVTLMYLISLLVYIIRTGIRGVLNDIKVIGLNCMKSPFLSPCKILLKIIKKVFIGGALRRSIMLLIFLIAVGIVDYHFYASDNYKNWFNREWALDDKLSSLSRNYEKELGKYTNHFFKINDGEIKEEDFEKHDFESYNHGDGDAVKFVVVDNKKHKVFWEYWALADLKVHREDKAAVDKNIIAYIKKNAYVYTSGGMTVGGDSFIPSPKYAALTGIEPGIQDVYMDMSIYYWLDKRDPSAQGIVYDTNLKINIAYKNIELLAVLIAAASVYLISVLLYIKKFGIKKFLSGIKSEFIEVKGKLDFVCEKLSFEGPYKKSVIIFLITLFFYIIICCIGDGRKDIAYFIKRIIFLEEPIVFVFIIFIFIVFLLFLKKIKNFKYTLEFTEKIAKGDLSLEIKKLGDIDTDKLAVSINSIRDGYERAFKEAVKNERVKTELIANVSHDLKTPLTSILTYVDLLKRDNLSLEEKEDYIKIVEKKTNKLGTLIEDLVEVSEVNSGKIKLNKEKIDMVSLIYQVIGECSNYHDEKNIKFKVKSFSEKVELYIDGRRMSRLIGNVISNSIKYSMPNTNVYVEVEKENDDIIVSFKSISEDEMKFDVNEIFDRFKRGDESRNSKVEGSGLGLAIAKGIAELHGGRMYAEKEGDLFKMFLVLKESLGED